MNPNQIFEEIFKTVVPYNTEGDIQILYYLARRSRAKATLEVGVYNGATSLILALLMKENNGIHYGIDIDQEHLNKFGRLAEEYGVRDNIRLFCADSGYIDWKIPLDLAFIDGNHNREWVLRDIDVFAPNIKRGGFLCFHDSFSEADGCDVGGALDMKWNEKWDRLDLPFGMGLTIWRLR